MNQQLVADKSEQSQTENRNSMQTATPSPKQLDPLIDVFKTAMNTGFYGSVEVKLENGRVMIIKKTESIKLS